MTLAPPNSQLPDPPSSGRSEQLIAIAAGLLALFAVILCVGLINLNGVQSDTGEDVQRTRAARVQVYGLMQASIDAESGQRGFLLSNDTPFLEPFDTGRTAALEHLARLDALVGDHPEIGPSIARVESLTHDALAALSDTLERRRGGQLSDQQFRAALNDSKALMDAARAEFRRLLATLDRLIDASHAEEQRIQDQLYLAGGVLTALALIAVALTMHTIRSERHSWRAAYEALAGANRATHAANAKAAASELAKARFLAVASHDMRQPLHALTLYLTALERRVETDEARGIVVKMERAVHAMVGMFTSLLDLAQLQAGVITPEPSDTPLQSIFDSVGAEQAAGRVEVASTPLVVHSDPRLLARVLSKLVANAIKHGGGLARLSARTSEGAVEIIIADDGPGIGPDDQQRVFEEFERLGAHGDGLGLGLTIVRQLTDLLGVMLTLDSKSGEGARFILRVPLASSATSSVREEPDSATLNGVPILVMDDDALAREAMCGLLRDLGAEVRACADGEEADATLQEGFAPKLLVLDLRIRGELLGLAIAHRLADKIDPPPGTIMVTGDTGPETLEALRASGYGWLIKPINPQDLSAVAAVQLRVCAA